MLQFIKEVSCRAWAKVDSINSDGSFVKITQGHEEEYSQFIGKLRDAIEKSIKDKALQNIILKQLAFEKMLMRNVDPCLDQFEKQVL